MNFHIQNEYKGITSFLIVKGPGNAITEHPDIHGIMRYHKIIVTHPS
jgi:hypothetical protein